MRPALLLLALGWLNGCARTEDIPRSPVEVPQGSDLKPYVGKRVRVRGLLLDRSVKGYPHLYADRTREQGFLVSFPDRIDWRARLDRESTVVGIVKQEPGFTEEQRQPGKIPQGYPEGAILIEAESLD